MSNTLCSSELYLTSYIFNVFLLNCLHDRNNFQITRTSNIIITIKFILKLLFLLGFGNSFPFRQKMIGISILQYRPITGQLPVQIVMYIFVKWGFR